MQISRLELSLLRLSDGIASKADLDRLSQHFDEEQLHAWRQVSGVVSRSIRTQIDSIDVSESVMQSLQTEEGAALTSFDRALFRRAISDNHIPDLSERVLSRLSVTERDLADVLNQEESSLDPTETTDSTNAMPVDDWSYNELLSSVLTDQSIDLDSLTDSIMSNLTSDVRTDQNEAQDNDNVDEGFFADRTLMKALESELNRAPDTEDSIEPIASTSSSMSFEHEIPSPVVAQKGLVTDSHDHNVLVEFTEEEEFEQQNVVTGLKRIEEDSDDEVCLVEEGFVTEEMLADQDKEMEQLQSILLTGAAKDLDVWAAIVNEVTQPPLRLLPEASDVGAIDKEASFIDEEEFFTPMESATNVEFLSSNSIDADSTISKVSITVLGSFLAVAAAWVIIVLPSLLTQTTSTINTPKRLVTFEVAEVNSLEVEDLEVGEDMNVQILQGDANAPTIIFLDDMEPL